MQSIPAIFFHLVVNYKDTTDDVHITVQKCVLDTMKQSGIISFMDFVIIIQCCWLFVVIDNNDDDTHAHARTRAHTHAHTYRHIFPRFKSLPRRQQKVEKVINTQIYKVHKIYRIITIQNTVTVPYTVL